MTILKPISGHTGLAKARAYLERDGRALARDFLNLDAPELPSDGPLPSYGEFDWASVMDATRAEFGNDAPWGDRRARTYKHYIVSPDPRDAAGLTALRYVTMSWVRECFPEHEVAVIYHDDNEGHVLHAHVVVNNTNLETGGRLRDPDPRALKRALQRISAEHGFSALAGHESAPWRRRRVDRAEREIMAKGEYSWVADIRERVAVARGAARAERDFVALLGRMGVVVEPSRSREGDWVYALADAPARRVTGARLGSAYTRGGVSSAMRTAKRIASPEAAERIVRLANGAIEVRDLRELGELARAVGFVSRDSIRSLAEMDRAISHSRDGSQAERLKALRTSCERYGLLPEKAATGRRGRSEKVAPQRESVTKHEGSSTQHNRHRQSRQSRSQEMLGPRTR